MVLQYERTTDIRRIEILVFGLDAWHFIIMNQDYIYKTAKETYFASTNVPVIRVFAFGGGGEGVGGVKFADVHKQDKFQ